MTAAPVAPRMEVRGMMLRMERCVSVVACTWVNVVNCLVKSLNGGYKGCDVGLMVDGEGQSWGWSMILIPIERKMEKSLSRFKYTNVHG